MWGNTHILQSSLRLFSGVVQTMQDGQLTFADSPVRYVLVLCILVAGYVVGLLAPWLIK